MSGFLIVNLVMVQAHQFLFLKVIQKSTDCKVEDDDLWSLYQMYFESSSPLTVTMLQEGEHFLEVRKFTEGIIHKLGTFDHTFLVQEKFLGNNCTNTIEYSTRGQAVIVWSANVLKEFLDRQVLLFPHRAKYALFIISDQHCQTITHDLNYTLVQFWSGLGALYVIAQAPCCGGTKIYVHLPFKRVENSWGATLSLDASQVLDNFEVITTSVHNLNQFPLKVSMFPRYPYVIKSLHRSLRTNPIYSNLTLSKGFGGLDALILRSYAEHLDFDPVVVDHKHKEPFGRVLPNGTITGSLGDVAERRVEVNCNGRFMLDYETDAIEFTVPYDTDKFCMVVPKALKVPTWRMLSNCFNVLSWLVILCMCITCTVFWYLIRPTRNVSKAIWEMYSYLVGIPVRFTPSLDQFVFLTSCMVFNVIIFGTIQGTFVTDFTTTLFYHDINTLDELYESNLPIVTDFWYLVEDDNSEVMKKLASRTVKTNGFPLYQVAHHRNAATLDRKQDLDRLIKTKYTSKSGTPLVHMVAECFTVHMVHIVPKGSIFLDTFNEVILDLVEGGFISKWYNDVISTLRKMTSTLDFTPATLYDMQAGFRVIAVGCFGAILVFLCEVVLKEMQK